MRTGQAGLARTSVIAVAALVVVGVGVVALVFSTRESSGENNSGRAKMKAAATPRALTNGGRPLPLDVTLSPTSNLHDGSEIALHVVPKQGSQIFGFEAFLCADKVPFSYDSDIRPTLSGKCVSKKLSPVSDDYEEVAAPPPYQSVDGTFRVGVGTDTYTMRDGKPVTITCGPGHPCQLVLKLQYPNDFGFAAYPLTFG
ncbi:MAG: hypothetical protein M3159_02660 [Actinomycetota bacterium]|nr:hypothetical protein [Actinomycetota bacterium]